jgi:uncharacterized protein YndB with AHSA1/START domain
LTRIEKSIEIKVPPEKVWEIIAFDRVKEWDEEFQKNVKSFEYTSEVKTPEDKYRVGTSTHLDIKGVGMGEFDFEVTESIENEKITYRAKRPGESQQMALMTFLLEPLQEGTKITYVYDYEMPWGVVGKLINRLGGQRSGEKMVERNLEKMKSILEK